MFSHAIPSRQIPKRTHEKKEASPKKKQRLAREYRADLRRRCDVTPRQNNTADVKTKKIYATGTSTTYEISDDGQPFTEKKNCVITSVQANLADFRKIRLK